MLKMFEAAGSRPDSAKPCFLVDACIPKKIPLEALDGPRRNIGHMLLDRLTVSGSEAAFFMLGSALVALARQSLAVEGEAVTRIELETSKPRPITAVCLRTWQEDDARDQDELQPGAAVRVPKVGSWISPCRDFDSGDAELPTFGVLRHLPPVLGQSASIASDKAAMYVAAPATGFLILGKLLAAFALEDVDAMQLENGLAFPGVARQSYELECLKANSFAAQALFGN